MLQIKEAHVKENKVNKQGKLAHDVNFLRKKVHTALVTQHRSSQKKDDTTGPTNGKVKMAE
jgi:hypothetical protein